MARFSRGKEAWGISDRSGFRYRLRDLREEWTGLKVGDDEFEVKHPQIKPRKIRKEAQALYKPRPDKPEGLRVYVGTPTVESYLLERPRAIGQAGTVTVSTP